MPEETHRQRMRRWNEERVKRWMAYQRAKLARERMLIHIEAAALNQYGAGAGAVDVRKAGLRALSDPRCEEALEAELAALEAYERIGTDYYSSLEMAEEADAASGGDG